MFIAFQSGLFNDFFNSTSDDENTLLVLDYKLMSDNTYSVVGFDKRYSRGCEEAVIPAEYNGLPVTHIGSEAFKGATYLKRITIGENVTSINSFAFTECEKLTDLYISNVEPWLYNGKTVYLGESSILHILDEKGNEVTDLVVPDGLTHLYDTVFYYCTALTSITIPDSVTTIDIPSYPPKGTSLTSITIAKENPKYYSERNCIIETESQTLIFGCSGSVIPDGVTRIGNNAFYNCTGLTSITIPNSVTSIGEWAFYGCDNLTSITIPDSVTSISEWAFYGCDNLTSVTMPGSIKHLGNLTFGDCDKLTKIYFQGTMAQWERLYFSDPWENTYNIEIICFDGVLR